LHTRFEGPLHVALSLALRRRADAGLGERSAAWLLNSKAFTQQALAEPLRLARAGADPQLTTLLGQLLDVRQQLARLTLAIPQPGQEEQRRRQLDDLARQERQLARELGRQSGEQLTDPGWVELAAVRQALPPDAVLIDIARFHVWAFRAKGREPGWQAPRYAAWVVPPKKQGEVRLIDLGEAAPLEAAAQTVRRLLAAAPQALASKKEAAVELQLRRALGVLAGRLLRPWTSTSARARTGSSVQTQRCGWCRGVPCRWPMAPTPSRNIGSVTWSAAATWSGNLTRCQGKGRWCWPTPTSTSNPPERAKRRRPPW
jgi:hypothetical protein